MGYGGYKAYLPLIKVFGRGILGQSFWDGVLGDDNSDPDSDSLSEISLKTILDVLVVSYATSKANTLQKKY